MTRGVDALNRVAKWRSLFAGWQLGTRSREDPEAQAVRDHREATILLRAEVSALAGLMIEKGVFTTEEWDRQLVEEAEALDKMYEQRFPGVTASDLGLTFTAEAAEWMRGWRP